MSKRFMVIVKNVVISFKLEYRRPTLTSRCEVTDDIISVENTFSEIICNDFFIPDVKMNLPKIIRNWPPFWGPSSHLNLKLYFSRNSVEYHDRPCYPLHFELLFDVVAQQLTELWQFQNLNYFFLPRDLVIWPLTNNICKPMWRTRLHLWTKYSDDWLQTATCIAENVTISFKHEYRRPSLTSPCDVVSDVINIKNTFPGIISDDLSIFVVKLNLSIIFRNFPNGHHFDVRLSFVTGSPTGSWVQRLEASPIPYI